MPWYIKGEASALSRKDEIYQPRRHGSMDPVWLEQHPENKTVRLIYGLKLRSQAMVLMDCFVYRNFVADQFRK